MLIVKDPKHYRRRKRNRIFPSHGKTYRSSDEDEENLKYPQCFVARR